MDILKAAGWLALYVYVCWALYALVMNLYRAKLNGTLTPVTKVLGWPWVAIGLVADVVLQLLATAVFFDLPRYQDREWLLTARLQRYMAGRDGWRKRWADWICTHWLDPLDARGDHC